MTLLVGCKCLYINTITDETSYFGVFDGHGGSVLADYVSKNLYKKITQHKTFSKCKSTFAQHHN